jgi:hypothetical protein
MRGLEKISWIALVAVADLIATILSGCGGSSTPPPPISVSVSAATATVLSGATAQFTANVANDSANKGVTWNVSCSAAPCGTVSPTTTPSGVPTTYAAPPTPPASDLTVTLIATSAADASKTSSTTITVPILTVTISPDNATVVATTAQQFTAAVTASNAAVTWTLMQGGAGCSPGCGTLSSPTSTSVTYNAPATPPASDLTVTLTATSVADTTKTGSATITVPAISVSVLPAIVTVAEDTSQPFTGTVTGDPSNKGVTWTLTQSGAACSPGCGTLSSQTSTSVTYNAPGTVPANPAVALTATPVADTTKSGSATITVVNPEAALNGHYAFLFNGFDDANGMQVAFAGSFTADGFGNITTGIEDINQPSGVDASVTFTGTYVIGLDNRGTTTFTNSLGGKVTYAFAVGSPNSSGVATKARLIEFDDSTGTTGTRGSGVMRLQDTTAFSQSSITGPYAFGFIGQAPSGKRRAVAGVFTADGAGNITVGTEDVNDAGTVANSVTFTGTYTAPSSTNGRATVTLTASGSSSHQSAYVVAPNELLVISTDAISSAGLTSGTELAQASTSFSNSSLNASAVFYEVGVNSASPATRSNVEIGLFSPDGNGGLSLTFDENNGGTITSNTTTSGLTYSIASNGRIAISGGTGSNPILYLVDTNKAFFLDTGGSVGFGFLEPQSRGLSISGKYFFGAAPPAVTGSTVSSGVASHTFRRTASVSTRNAISRGVTPSALRVDAATTASAAAWRWSLLALCTVLGALVACSGRRVFRNARVCILAGIALLVILGPAGCPSFLNVTQDSSSSGGTLTVAGTASSQLTSGSNGRTTTSNSGVIYIISPNKFVLIDESTTDMAPTVQIFER